MPLLWFRLASDGSEPDRYTLQVPFQLANTHALTQDVTEVTYDEYRLEVVENHGIQLLRVKGFRSKLEAEAYLPRLRGALLRVIVRKRLSARSTEDTQEVQVYDPPKDVRGNPNFGDMLEAKGWTHLDGSVDASPVVVIPEHLRIMEFGVGSMSVTLGIPISSFLENVADGLQLPTPEAIAADKRLSLAIDIYSASHWETSPRARVITLSTALEVLSKPEVVGTSASGKISELLEVLDSSRDSSAEDDEHRVALDRLRSRLAGLKQESISETLRHLASTHAHLLGETPDEARRNMASAYNVRSKLVHEGHATSEQISSAASWLGKTVPLILESLADKAAKRG